MPVHVFVTLKILFTSSRLHVSHVTRFSESLDGDGIHRVHILVFCTVPGTLLFTTVPSN
jgi:hypothetical protein